MDTRYSVSSGFFNSVGTDRTYSAEDMNRVTARLVSEGVFPAESGGASTDFQVTAGSGLQVSVASGEARMGDKWVRLSSALTINLTSENATRCDSIILQMDDSSEVRASVVIYRTGTSGSTTPPSLSQSLLEFRLANIIVTNNAIVSIEDKRGTTDCPYCESILFSSRINSIASDVTNLEGDVADVNNNLELHSESNAASFNTVSNRITALAVLLDSVSSEITNLNTLVGKAMYLDGGNISFDWAGAGYIYDSKFKIHFCVPLPKYCDSELFTLSRGIMKLRVYQNGEFILGTATEKVDVTEYTYLTNYGNFVFVEIRMPVAMSNAINRAECGINADVTFVLTENG